MEPTPIWGGAGVLGSGLVGFLKGYPSTHHADAAPHKPTLLDYILILPDVQRWTKILEFLYCGYGTVINLSGEGHLKKLERGTVGCRNCQNYLVCAWGAA